MSHKKDNTVNTHVYIYKSNHVLMESKTTIDNFKLGVASIIELSIITFT